MPLKKEAENDLDEFAVTDKADPIVDCDAEDSGKEAARVEKPFVPNALSHRTPVKTEEQDTSDFLDAAVPVESKKEKVKRLFDPYDSEEINEIIEAADYNHGFDDTDVDDTESDESEYETVVETPFVKLSSDIKRLKPKKAAVGKGDSSKEAQFSPRGLKREISVSDDGNGQEGTHKKSK